MKNTTLIFFLISIAFNVRWKRINDPAEQMLRDFYIAYNTAWSTTNNNILIKKLNSLQAKYCTISARKEIKKLFNKAGLDHDALINDEYTDVQHLNTLNIIKDRTVPNEYIVSYIVSGKDASGKQIDIRNTIHVTIIKEGGSFKINNAYGNEIRLR